MSAIFSWGIHIWNFKTVAYASKSVTNGRKDGRTDEQPRSNMPLQLLWSWGHNNSSACVLLEPTATYTPSFYCWNIKGIQLNLYKWSPLNNSHPSITSTFLGPVVQSVVSLTSSLRVISLTVLADSIYNILIFFAEKMWVPFALQKLLTFFQQKISAYLRVSPDVNFNESLTNDVVSFEQLGPDFQKGCFTTVYRVYLFVLIDYGEIIH